MRVKTPDHPIDRLASYELRDYRDQLEAALTDTLTGPERQIFQERLTAVTQEQDARRESELRSLGLPADLADAE